MSLPRTLSNHPLNPHFNKDALLRVDKVYVDGVHLPNCCYYSKDKHEARAMDAKRNWLPMQHGEITVTEKQIAPLDPGPVGANFSEIEKRIADTYREVTGLDRLPK